MRILIVAATPFEIAPLRAYLEENFSNPSKDVYEQEDYQIRLLITGVGQMLTAYAMGYVLAQETFDFAINAGVAGSYNQALDLGQVVNVESDCFGDLGAEDADGSFLSIHDLGLINAEEAPFQLGHIQNPTAINFDFLTKSKGVTMNTVRGYAPSIEATRQKHQADVESMEGAAFAYICRLHELAFLQIRSISNYVEPRNKAAWKMKLAIQNLNQVLQEMIGVLG